MAGPESQIKELELYYEDDGVTTGTLEQGTGQTRHGFGITTQVVGMGDVVKGSTSHKTYLFSLG